MRPPRPVAAVPVTNATKGFVAGELTKVLTSVQFQAIWTAALTATHQQLVAVLRGQDTGGCFHLWRLHCHQHRPPGDQALAKVSGLASDLAGKPVTLPAITSVDPPQQAVTKLSKALESPCPATSARSPWSSPATWPLSRKG